MDKLLKEIVEVFGVSGHEKKVVEVIKQQLKDVKCEICEDKLGNIIVKKGAGSSKIMICTNMDVKGVIAYYIEEDGKVRIHNLGDFEAEDIVDRTISFESGISGKISSEVKKKPEFRDLYVDLGFKTREAALRYVKEGDTACFEGNTYEEEDTIISSSLSNRINCFILLNLIKEIEAVDKEIYFVFSTQGELQARGARAAAFDIKPDICLALSTENEKDVKIGDGPAVVVMQKGLIMHRGIKDILEKNASKLKMDIQLCVSNEISDGSTVHKEVNGIPTGTISIPCKNKGSINEIVNINDVNNCIKLITYSINNDFNV